MNSRSFNPDETALPGIRALRPYQPGKPMEELERELGLTETLKLASNENPLGPSPLGAEAAAAAAGGVNLYPDDVGFRLRNKLAQRLAVAPEAITLGSGSSDVIDMVARSFLGPGRNAVYAQYCFAMYPIYTQACGAEGRTAPAYAPDHPWMAYGHDLESMAEAVDDDTRVVFVTNPNNPTGTWSTRGELEAFLQSVPRHVVVVLDEAYTEYVRDDEYPDGVALLPDYPNLVVTRTFSKIYGLAGLRVGYGVSSPELAGMINRVRHPFNVNSAALAAAEAALDDEDFLRRSVEVNRKGLVQLREGLEGMGLKVIPSVGNFITVDLGRSAEPVYDALLREGVIVRPIANYGMPDHLRITVGMVGQNERVLEALGAHT
ncbi:MAG: histidinol-phosphate transaminase [Pseudomonadota bacterium]|nr:histidinol-phosphate transaminase [Pseudomonadota bacterium]